MRDRSGAIITIRGMRYTSFTTVLSDYVICKTARQSLEEDSDLLLMYVFQCAAKSRVTGAGV